MHPSSTRSVFRPQPEQRATPRGTVGESLAGRRMCRSAEPGQRLVLSAQGICMPVDPLPGNPRRHRIE
jgi:hypothetical protein